MDDITEGPPTNVDPGSDYPPRSVRGLLPPKTTPGVLNLLNEDEIHADVERAKAGTVGLQGIDDGTAMDTVISITSSDLCWTIVGYVDKLVQLGDVISTVIFSVTIQFAFIVLHTMR